MIFSLEFVYVLFKPTELKLPIEITCRPLLQVLNIDNLLFHLLETSKLIISLKK